MNFNHQSVDISVGHFCRKWIDVTRKSAQGWTVGPPKNSFAASRLVYLMHLHVSSEALHVWYCIQWGDLRENLQETIELPMKYGIFPVIFPLNFKPIN